jgi:hypothetical protein
MFHFNNVAKRKKCMLMERARYMIQKSGTSEFL